MCFQVTDAASSHRAEMLVVFQIHVERRGTLYTASSMFGPAYNQESALFQNPEVHHMHIYHELRITEKRVLTYLSPDGTPQKLENCSYEIGAFYNYLLNAKKSFYKMMTSEEQVLFRGLGKGMLCALIESYDILDDPSAVIVLEAYGNDPRKNDMYGLVRLYESLSFRVIGGTAQDYIEAEISEESYSSDEEESEERGLEIPMKTTIGELYRACEKEGLRKLFREGTVGVIVQ